MKNLFKITLGLIVLAMLTVFSTSCEKEKDEGTEADKPYVGEWESKVYPQIDFSTGEPVGYEKMSFVFTNTSFTDEISRGTSADNVVPQITMSGDIDSPADNLMDVEINKIIANGITISMESDADLFQATFAATIGKMLDRTFQAEYEIGADSMVFTIPVKTPLGLRDTPLTLYKK